MRAERPSDPSDIEWPTIALAAAIYGSWAVTIYAHDRIPPWLTVALGGWLVAWHGSLQHETIHGHPTPYRLVNAAIGSVPLALWLPYAIYRRDHLRHHSRETVTYPGLDPESRYLSELSGRLDRSRAMLASVQATLIGRLLFGPPILVTSFLFAELRRLFTDPLGVGRDWWPHLAGCALVIGYLTACHFPVALYAIGVVYLGTALTLLRSFAEHRAAPQPGHRVAVVEYGGLFALLFLNNNLHAAHHRAPTLAWFRLPRFFRANRAAILADNGGLRYRSYGEVARRFAFRAHDVAQHPHLP